MPTERLDALLTSRGLFPSREQAQRAVLAGEVWLGTQRLEKPGVRVSVHTPLEVRSRAPLFASRGGFKLEHALNTFKVSPSGRVCLDVGSSTGGFTDCLLKRGASRVFALDVGTGQLDQKLRVHPQVSVMERTNARFLTAEQLLAVHPDASQIDLVVADVSFISLRLLIEPVSKAACRARDWLLLFKPQFEVGPKNVGRGGLVRRPQATKEALANFSEFMEKQGFSQQGASEDSPLLGKKSGNKEILLHYEKL